MIQNCWRESVSLILSYFHFSDYASTFYIVYNVNNHYRFNNHYLYTYIIGQLFMFLLLPCVLHKYDFIWH